MLSFESIDQNFQFLVLETQSLVDATLEFYKSPEGFKYDDFFLKDDYIDNLKNTIENQCYKIIIGDRKIHKLELNRIRVIQISSVNLERIADNCINVLVHADYLKDKSILSQFDFQEGFRIIRESIENIFPTYETRNLAGALEICKAEPALDEVYEKNYHIILEKLKEGDNIPDLLDILFIFRYLERIGDTILNVGEALIFEIIGDKIKIQQFKALEKTLSQSGFEGPVAAIDFESIRGTRSGNRIGRVERGFLLEDQAQESIFKEGNIVKIKAEKESLEEWSKILPGLTPKVIGYNEGVDTASILEQHIPGSTIDEIIISSEHIESVVEIINQLKETLKTIWCITKNDIPIETDFIKQLQKRITHVKRVHPNFERFEQNLGKLKIISSGEMISQCTEIEKNIRAPFTVRIHGDFNINNIFYDQNNRRIHYIDVYRSKQADYIQDISVFLVSNFRIPIFDEVIRARLNWVIADFFKFSCKMAYEWGDTTFNARLALALARSYYTSTRFELNNDFAKEMYHRAIYLMEKVIKYHNSGNSWDNFDLPSSLITY